MGELLNLNRFRKKKAREEKLKRADTNRRLHGRSKAERAQEDALKKRIEDKLEGAFLVRESVRMEDIPTGDSPGDFERLEALIESAPPLTSPSLASLGERGQKRDDDASPSDEEERSSDE